ncbi:hypothetical protein COBT_000428 [Conglomerata obtusa]
MSIMFLAIWLVNIQNIQSTIVNQARRITKELDKLVATRCFSTIQIYIDEPCNNKELLNTCTFKNCQIPRDMSKTEQLVPCRTGKKVNNQCVFSETKDNKAVIIDLNTVKQIYSGYKDSSSVIWQKIYESAEGNKSLTRMISGIHCSITAHIAMNYKSFNNIFIPNYVFFSKRVKKEYIDNLYYAFRMVRNSFLYLSQQMTECSIELTPSDNKCLINTMRTIQNKLPFNVNKAELKDAQNKLKRISKITNCIECDKCKLWGKIQFQGLLVVYKLLSGAYRNKTIPGNDLICLVHLLHKLGSSISFVHIMENKSFPYISYVFLYIIEICVFIFSLLFFYVLNRMMKKKIELNNKKKKNNKKNN